MNDITMMIMCSIILKVLMQNTVCLLFGMGRVSDITKKIFNSNKIRNVDEFDDLEQFVNKSIRVSVCKLYMEIFREQFVDHCDIFFQI